MKQKEIYFDNNATTRPLPEVREEVLKVMGPEFGNPSSAHSTGSAPVNIYLKPENSLHNLLAQTVLK